MEDAGQNNFEFDGVVNRQTVALDILSITLALMMLIC